MARKNAFNYQLLSNQSLSASFNSPATVVEFLDNCSYQINITTTDSTGTFAVQASNDYAIENGFITNAGNWIALTLAGGVPFVAAANDQIIINLNQLPFKAIRLAYVSTIAGTGTINVFVTDKQIGG